MSFKVDTNFVKPLQPKPLPKPEPKAEPKQLPELGPKTEPNPPIQQQQYDNVSAKKVEAEFVGANNRFRLEKQFAANQPSPSKALEEINNLPKPDLNDKAAVKAYKEQRKQIADNAVKNSQPPRIEDYRNSGLNGATASYEYREAKSYYDSQISQLKKISAEAATYPDQILSPYEAVEEINNLPRPDRNDPQAILEYNNKRAEIANAALMYAEPPNREDYLNSGLNGATANYEYQQAKAYYDSAIRQLTESSNAQYSTTPPPINDAEAEQAAQDLINKHGGADNTDEAYAVGQDLAEIAKTNPEEAALIMNKVQDKLINTDKGDNVASGFVDNLSDAQLRATAETLSGGAMLDDLKSHLLDGNVHESEQNQAARIGLAVDPGAQIAEWLDQKPSEYYEQKVYDYLKSVEDSGDINYIREVGDKIADSYSSWSTDKQEEFINFLHDNGGFASLIAETDSGGNNKLVSDYVRIGVDNVQDGNFDAQRTVGNILEAAAGNEQVSLELLNKLRTEGLGDYAGKGDAAVNYFLDYAVLSRDQKDGKSALAIFVEGAKDFKMENAMEIFNTVAANDRHIEQEGVTDALSTIFLKHGDAYLLSPQFASDGYANEAKAETLANYFEHALFSEDSTKTAEVIDYVSNFSIRVAEHITKGEPLPGVTGSYPVEESAKLLGSLYRIFADGLKQASASATADAEQQKKMFGLVAGLAFAFIPGGSAVTAGLSSTVAKTVTEYIYSKTVDGVKTFTEKEVQELIGLGVPREVAERIKNAPADLSERLKAFGLPADVATDLENFMNNGGGNDPVTQMRGLILIALPPNLEGNFQDGYDETGNRLEN